MRIPFLILGFCLTPLAWACIHGPEGYEGEFHQEGQQALAVWDGGQEDLFLRPTVVFEEDAPAEIAWVIPVPSVPSHYAEDKGRALEDLVKRYRDLTRPRSARNGPPTDSVESFDDDASKSMELLEAKVAGDYTIQPIKAHGEAGAKALGEWLQTNGFGVVPAENMRYYVEREWVWLCVKAKPSGRKAKLAPLQITFATPRVVYPLKFSTHQGTFALELFVVTKAPCPEVTRQAKPYGLQHRSLELELPASTAAALKGAKLSGKVSLTRLYHPGLSGETIIGWERDLALTPAP